MTRIGNVVSVLAGGPSLRNARPVGDRIAVNFAAHVVPAYEWLAFTDPWFADTIGVTTNPPLSGIITTASGVPAMQARFPGLPVISDGGNRVSEWPCCTAQLAIVIADQIMDYREIHLFGFDMDGDRYATGAQHEVHELRWPRERRCLDQLIRDMRQRGRDVVKH